MNSVLTLVCISFLGNSALNPFENPLKWGENWHQISKLTLNIEKNKPINLEVTESNSSDEEDGEIDPVPTA